MVAKVVLSSLLILAARFGFAQPDSILSFPKEKQVMVLWRWYNSYLSQKDSQQVVKELEATNKMFAEQNNELLQRQIWLMQHLYNNGRKTWKEQGDEMLKSADEAGTKGWDVTQAECWHYAGNFYFRLEMFVQAFEYMLKAQNVFDKYENEKHQEDNYQYVLRYADGTGTCYYHFGEYRETIRYLKKTLLLPPYWSLLIQFQSIHNTIALCYQQLREYDSAAIWYHKSYETAAAVKDSFYMALANGNLGYTYYLQKKYDEAIPLIETDCATSLRANETGSAAFAASTLAAIYIKKGQITLAEKFMGICRQFVFTSGNIPLYKIWYENLYNLSKAKGDYKNAGIYSDSLLFYKDSLAVINDKKAFNQAVLKIEMEKHLHEVSELESNRSHQILLRNSLLVGLVLLAVIALLWVNRQSLKHNKEKELARQRLQFAEQELVSYTVKLQERNELLQQLRDELNRESDNTERTDNINRLLSTTILTEDDWKKFRELFEKVYPGFFISLRDKMPDLSPTETRILALTKLQLPPKDMASMLGVSYDAIKKARQRLRKKINLPENDSWNEVVDLL